MNISEFERQKQYRIDIVKKLVAESLQYNWLYDSMSFAIDEKELSRLVKEILVEIDKV